MVYTQGGETTGALIEEREAIVESRLYWIPCKGIEEAHYLLAIINSDTLQEKVTPLMSKGQFGPRDLHKHVWMLPIPEFDLGKRLHHPNFSIDDKN